MRLYKLPDTVLSIKGNAASFLNGITSNTTDALQNAFLNQHGRIIATFLQQKVSDDEFLAAVPSVAVDGLLKHLERYAKLSRVSITPSDVNAYIDVDAFKTVWTSEAHPNSISDDEFTRLRLLRHFPLMGVDYHADEFILNVHAHAYVSYTKGCFLGQEPVAKVHNRSRPSRQLVVMFEDEGSRNEGPPMTSKVLDPVSGRTQGFKFISSSLPLRG